MKTPVAFVSRELHEHSVLRATLERSGYLVHDRSLIKVSPIRFTHTPKCDWIFFSSRNAVKHFFGQDPAISPTVRFAVFGKGTEETLFSFGRKADFVGEGNDAAAIARQFISLLDGDIVLFPQAIDSLQTVQRWLPFNNIARNLFVYKTSFRTDIEIPEADLLIFTSPSNVNAYFSKYRPLSWQKVIAIGTSTKITLKSKGVHEVLLPKEFSEQAIADIVNDLSRVTDTHTAIVEQG